MRPLLIAALCGLPGLALADELKGFVSHDRLPIPDQPVLVRGGTIWADSCQNCHGGNPATGAPKITSEKKWAPRIEQGFEVLFDHAINGYLGPKYTQMPARGGNSELSDDEVRAAVAFMVWASGGEQAAVTWAQENSEKDN